MSNVAPGYNFRRPGPFGGPLQPNYPRNCWWPAARSSEVTNKPYACQMLDTPVVLYRRASDGGIAALHDRCVHRWAPLSAGWVEGDRIICAYHGSDNDAGGKCVRMTTQPPVAP